MARLAWAFLLLAAACSASQASRIVGGDTVSIEDYPFMVQIERWYAFAIWNHIGSGVVLTRRSCLSTASNFEAPLARPQNRRVRAGATDRGVGGMVREVSHIYNHPSYGKNGNDGDISVVLLMNPLDYSPSIAQASIIAQGASMPDNLPVYHAGWGRNSFIGEKNDKLTEVAVRTVNNDLCRERYLNWPSEPAVTENMICAGLLDVSAAGICFGDSGSPLIFENIIIGMGSWSRNCANATYPGVSTAVSPYTSWIVETVG